MPDVGKTCNLMQGKDDDDRGARKQERTRIEWLPLPLPAISQSPRMPRGDALQLPFNGPWSPAGTCLYLNWHRLTLMYLNKTTWPLSSSLNPLSACFTPSIHDLIHLHIWSRTAPVAAMPHVECRRCPDESIILELDLDTAVSKCRGP